ncbi:hypothetical protein ES703_67107 [subsurface metagenome]
MGEIKSAVEIAMEKVEKLGKATDEERLEWKYVPEGKKLAGKHIRQGSNLVAGLSQYQDNVKRYIIQGAAEVLISNINLPNNDIAKRSNRRAMEGLKVVKSDKASVENVYSKMRRIFDHYVGEGAQQRKQAYQSVKAEFEAKMKQALQQQLGTFAGIKLGVERQPQFQQEWRRVQTQLDSQYLKLLDEYKQELSAIS